MTIHEITQHIEIRFNERSPLKRVHIMGDLIMYFNRSREIFVPSKHLFFNGTDKLYKLEQDKIYYKELSKYLPLVTK